MSEGSDEQAERDAPPAAEEDEAAPDWAAEIQRQRRVRGDRLRRIFATFEDEQEER